MLISSIWTELPFYSIEFPFTLPSVLACGAWLKNTVCVTRSHTALVSPVIGDLDTAQARSKLDETVLHMCKILNVQPKVVAHDLHPDFYSTHYAHTYAAKHDLPILAVQHHHAHIAAICAEHGISETVLGLALDGVGLGIDKVPWGGELLRVEGGYFERLGHLATLAMPGGDRAAREPWRMAAAALFDLGHTHEIALRFPAQPAVNTVVAMLQRNLNCPATSSMGRLFDTVAGLLGVNEIQSHEAQAAIQLQTLAASYSKVSSLEEGYQITANNVLDFSPLLAWLMQCSDVAKGAAVFHATLADGLAKWVALAARKYHCARIALGGGCFHNELLLQLLSQHLAENNLQVLYAKQLPPDDSAISLGQAWVAAQWYESIGA
ncbi:carbamoyltransferase HypF [Nitrosomonas communis]|uniref:Hydrogenase maturation protein HypF n=1 Tax=Nitrosomonas communis TaxID=44574 RepID=A0A1H2XP06_9PROT|nr:carbamoyltransferase HypF [Nitrosomonas communis]SDW94476.1 hydrogenase maturation protein HypF [Nitrosomonas communis]